MAPPVNSQWLVLAIIAGSGAACALLLATIAGRVTRAVAVRRAALAAGRVRLAVLRVLSGREDTGALAAARGAHGRAVELVVFEFLSQVEGPARERLTHVLDQRGTIARLLRQSGRRRPYQRALAASRLGDVTAASAWDRLAQLVGTDRNPQVRRVATRALGRARTPAAAAALLASLRRSHPVPAGIVAAALLDIGTPAAPLLREVVRADSPATSTAEQTLAAEVLGALKDLQSWEELGDCAQSGDPLLRMTAVRSLGYLGLRRSAGTVARRLARDSDPVVRTAAAWALGRIRDPASVGLLRRRLADPDHAVVAAAAAALATLGTPGRQALQEAATGDRPGAGDAREALARHSGSGRAGLPPVMWPAARRWPPPAPVAGEAR
jgi:HEAT repeat protein